MGFKLTPSVFPLGWNIDGIVDACDPFIVRNPALLRVHHGMETTRPEVIWHYSSTFHETAADDRELTQSRCEFLELQPLRGT